MRGADTLARPAFTMPPGACDSHVHVFESATRYPSVSTPHYTLPDGTLTPDAGARERIRVANPARLFGFEE